MYNKSDFSIDDFVGRNYEIKQFKSYLDDVILNSHSLAIGLEGQAGVGKTTFFNFIDQTIQREIKDEIDAYFTSSQIDVLSTYFTLSTNIKGFGDMWYELLNGLRETIDEEFPEAGFLELLAHKLIYAMFNFDKHIVADIIWSDENRPKNLNYVSFKDVFDAVNVNTEKVIPGIQSYYRKNKKKLRTLLRTEINGVTFKLDKHDNSRIIELFKCLDEDDDYLELVEKASPEIFRNENHLISYFNDLCRYYTCATSKKLVLLIGIDEFSKYRGDYSAKEEYFTNLSELLVTLRNILKNILFVLISITDDWENFKQVINSADQANQLTPFLKPMELKQLSIKESIRVFQKRMLNFWKNFPSQSPPSEIYYPFNDEIFEIVLRFNYNDLRKSIQCLNSYWNEIRNTRSIPLFENKLNIIKYVRDLSGSRLTFENILDFEKRIIRELFEKHPKAKANSGRSSMVETGLENAWLTYRMKKASITNVYNNKQFKLANGQLRRPDVLVEIHGNRGNEYRRVVEFQVKFYRGEVIKFNEIESSLELFDQNYTDFLYFIITSAEFDTKAQAQVDERLRNLPNRVVKPKLNLEQEFALILLAMYDEIYGWEMGKNFDFDIINAESALYSILNRSPEAFISMIETLSVREFIKPLVVDTSHKEIAEIKGKNTGKKPNSVTPSQSQSSWWEEELPEFIDFKTEACALGIYIKGRNKKQPKSKNKFTAGTVKKNAIIPNRSTSEEKFYEMIEFMKSTQYLMTVKRSLMLTEKGIQWYNILSNHNFEA